MKQQLAQWFLASGGWLVAILTLVIGYLERRQGREEERLAETLEYFVGGSQRRSVGIALIEGLWANKPRHHAVIVPLIANQIVYLLLSTDSVDIHNKRNLERLFDILITVPNLRRKYLRPSTDVLRAIRQKLEGNEKGIPLSPALLDKWKRDLLADE